MNKHLKSFVLGLVLVMSGGISWASAYSDFSLSTAPKAVMTFYYSSPNTRGFFWMTSTTTKTGSVWIVPGATATAADYEAATPLTATRTSHTSYATYQAHTGALTPGHYCFRIGATGAYAYGEFDISDGTDSLTLVNVSDIQTKDASLISYWEKTAAAIDADSRSIDFILSTGDYIDSNGPTGYSDYIKWGVVTEISNAQGLDEIPWVMASGNHDNSQYTEYVTENFEKTPNGVSGCHAFLYGETFIVTIPYISNMESSTSISSSAGTVLDWLDTRLAADDAQAARWRIVALHAGPYTTGDHGKGESAAYIQRVAGICANRQVDVCLQGHDHTYSKTRAYKWGTAGYTDSVTNPNVIELSPTQIQWSGEAAYDLNPTGTYYVSVGCSGSRVGENTSYADKDGRNSYATRSYKIATDTIDVDSTYALVGDDGSKDVGHPMFAVLQVNPITDPLTLAEGKSYTGSTLTYDWYVVNKSSGAVELFDTLRLAKLEEIVPIIDPTGTDEPMEVKLEPGESVTTLSATQSETWSYRVTGTTDPTRYLTVTITPNEFNQAEVAITSIRASANDLVVTLYGEGDAPVKTITILTPIEEKGSDADVTIETIQTGVLTNFLTTTTADSWYFDVSKPEYVMTVFETNRYGQASLSLRGLYPCAEPILINFYADTTHAKTVVLSEITEGSDIHHVPSSNIFAMVEVSPLKYESQIIPIPWCGYTEDGSPALDERIDHVVWPLGLVEDDMVLAVSNTIAYAAWSLDVADRQNEKEAGAKQWLPIETAWRGDVSLGERRTAVTANSGEGCLARGYGIWLIRQAADKDENFTLYGQYAEGPAQITVPGGSDDNPVCVMLANPIATEGLDIIEDIDWPKDEIGEHDKLIITTGKTTTKYIEWDKSKKAWRYSQAVYDPMEDEVVTKYFYELDPLPAGCGFWYVRRTAGAITLTIGKQR